MSFHSKALLVLFALTLTQGAAAQEPAGRQEHASLRQTVEQYLRTQANGLPGTVSIALGAIDPRLSLPACTAPEAFLPPGARVWGRTTVGVRCRAPSPWTVYISATVRVHGEYIATAAPLIPGQSIGPKDIAKVRGDLTALPPGIVTDPSQALGRTVVIALPAGTPLRQDGLRSQQAIRQGQTVRVESSGPGFTVSSEARALNNANEGEVAQARAANGQMVSGVARIGGVVEVTF
jgi:flagella basal body P-ring formation protein FlgA